MTIHSMSYRWGGNYACLNHDCMVHEASFETVIDDRSSGQRRRLSGHGMYCHDLEAMSSNPGQVEFGVHSTSLLVVLETENNFNS